jgi:hypothetical protein
MEPPVDCAWRVVAPNIRSVSAALSRNSRKPWWAHEGWLLVSEVVVIKGTLSAVFCHGVCLVLSGGGVVVRLSPYQSALPG